MSSSSVDRRMTCRSVGTTPTRIRTWGTVSACQCALWSATVIHSPSTLADPRRVASGGWDENDLPLTNAVLQFGRGARHSIRWGCHGVRPPRIFAETLADAVERGVEVHLITN